MAGIKNHTPSAGAVVAPIEGKTIWDTTNLTYAFATTSDGAEVNSNISLSGSETFNALDGGTASETALSTAVLNAFAAYEQVSNLTFTLETNFSDADIKVVGIDNFGPLGRMNFPGQNLMGSSSSDYESYMQLNTTSSAISSRIPAEAGGSEFPRFLAMHELGHGIGLGHPHDTGGGTTAVSSSGTTGDIVLDNERYTVLSYEVGGRDVQTFRNHGHAVTPSPLDIAALQAMYGANPNTNNTDTTYTLVDRTTGSLDVDGSDGTVQIGRAFFSIWDTGAKDEIVYSGSKRVVLNLNDATLSTTDDAETQEWIEQVKLANHYSELPNEFQNDIEDPNYHAGGFFSRIFETATNYDLGGYSIANGVEIENATASGGNDFLIGNEFNNTLKGNGGEDFLHGANGNDNLQGGVGNDEIVGGRGNDTLDGGDGDDVAIYSGNCADYDITRDETTGAITISHVRGEMIDGSDILQNIEEARFKDGTIDLTSDNLDCPPIDFIFLVDLSGSFSDDLPNFVSSARSITNSVRSSDPNSQFAIASFIDQPVSPYGVPGDYLYNADLSLTDSIADFESALAGLSTRNGNDIPEAQYVGLWRAANGIGLNLRENSRKIILIATDAPAHSAADYGLDETNILNFLENEGITVTSGFSDVVSASTDTETIGISSTNDFPDEEIIAPDDTGNGIIPDLSDDGVELLLSEVSNTLSTVGATPIFAVTSDVRSTYENIEAVVGRGSTVTLDRDGENIADAVRLALAEITGEVTEAGSDGDDTLIGSDGVQDVLFGGPGNDQIEGRGENDTLDGGSDADTILGEAGNDIVRGGTGKDTLNGGEGDDIIEPGADIDDITLGADNDIVRGTASELNGDTIQDFGDEDKIVVLGATFADLEVTSVGGNSLISFNGGSSITLTGDFSADDFTVLSSGTDDDAFTTIAFSFPPTITSNPNFSVSENTTNVGTITVEDPDGDDLTFSISGGVDQELFSINNSGELTFNNAPDFENATDSDGDNNYQVQVAVSDASETVNQELTISVTDEEEKPTVDDATFTIDENSEEETQVGIITATDPENDALTFAIANGNLDPDNDTNLAFAIDPSTGVITVNDKDDLDFETTPSFNLEVTATDTDNLSYTANITINLTDVPPAEFDTIQSQNGLFALNGGDPTNIKFTLANNNTENVNEVGVFVVDDENGNIDGLAPGSDGYLQAALERAQVIFSAITNRPTGFDLEDIERILEVDSDARLGFYLVSNGTTDTALADLKSTGTTSLPIFFSDSSNLQVSDLAKEGFKLNWSDEIGNGDFTDMELSVQLTQDTPTSGTDLQGQTQNEIIDLRDITGQVSVNVEVHREANFDNLVGFYQITDTNGGIDIDGDGVADLNPGDSGYTEAALTNRITGLDLLQTDNQQTATFDGTFDGGSILAPFIVVDGTVDEAINNNAEVYFSFLGANTDRADHIRLLGDNSFGFEDLSGGGDNDFNDVIVRVNVPTT
ncbi:cadherin domain-containing protein [Mastigocoleus sp. MO_188.B34]|uniref:cadherin domain-containing protein n=1 Tax=Mastigocoleus sp. MO_188.B34 TaxID=3036635 RepID=UPI002624B2D4|nr:cadherin domain-containing protein [Mastigocoleus sp. MO_188.B34]MDJ0697010.1 cadherin domain-containing protein [Mastigocoleus sp. MO_188.B34]